jgi:hypothetical protein
MIRLKSAAQKISNIFGWDFGRLKFEVRILHFHS